jgi:hypothetical protein
VGAWQLTGAAPVGYGEPVEGVIEQFELDDAEGPLALLCGGHRSVDDLPGQG